MEIDIQKLAETLQGTCMTLEGGIQVILGDDTEQELTPQQHDELDQEVFLCDTCGWWCEAHERSESDECVDCSGDNDDEDSEDDD